MGKYIIAKCIKQDDVYAPYMPVLSTDVLMPADFRGQQGYATSYGTKMVNGKMYLRGKITG